MAIFYFQLLDHEGVAPRNWPTSSIQPKILSKRRERPCPKWRPDVPPMLCVQVFDANRNTIRLVLEEIDTSKATS